jgi:putative Holliday junction resolvase
VTLPVATVLAFDFGTRRIGMAIGNTLTGSARELSTIDETRDEQRWNAIASVIAEWQPQILVVGLPVHADGAPHAMTARAAAFAQRLRTTFAIAVETADERHTTQAAQAEIVEAGGGRAAREARDAVAARLILQGWLDERARADS